MLNQLARRGLMVPARVVSTMSEYVRDLTSEVREAGGVIEDRLLRRAIETCGENALQARSGSPRLRIRIANMMREFWAAGADSYHVEPAARSRQQRSFVKVFREFESSLARAGLSHSNQRIAKAAARIREQGLDAVRTVYVDGFDIFTKQQEELLSALDEQAEEFIVAMPEGLPRYPAGKREPLPPRVEDGAVQTELVAAASPRAEVLEIARRILASDRPLHQHAIIVRSLEHYAGPVREALEALHIPHRFWSRDSLAEHGVTRHFVNWLRAIESRFCAERTLEAIGSPLSPVAADPANDKFDFAVREVMPGQGLEFLVNEARRSPGIKLFLQELAPCRDWHRRRVGAKRWHRECLELLDKVQRLRPPVEPDSFQRTCDWRVALRARQALPRALEETAELPEFAGKKRPSLKNFTDALEDVLRNTALAVPDQRFDVVHVLPIAESRQWSIPVAYVCGLAEGWFPRNFAQDIFFDDEDRVALRERGLDLRTSADKAQAERRLFEIASTRATQQLVLSYPLRDSRGESLVRSSLIEDRSAEVWTGPRLRMASPAPAWPAGSADSLPSSLLRAVAERNPQFSVSGIGDFRQCPYRFFSGTTLRLRGRPPLPGQRLDALALGTVVHAAVDKWNRNGGQIGQILDDVFRKKLQELHLEETFRTERYRLALRADLERFADSKQTIEMAVPDGMQSRFEEAAEFSIQSIGSQPVVKCRIDRYDVDQDLRCLVTDYKYARPKRVKELLKQHLEGEELQMLLYLAALEQQMDFEPTGMVLCGLRGETSFAGAAIDGEGGLLPISQDAMRSLLDTARREAAEAVGEVLEGGIAVRPRDRQFCAKFCEFGSICRVAWPRPRQRGESKDGAV
jgi:ATP-dependent helicase/DNAse subunit B